MRGKKHLFQSGLSAKLKGALLGALVGVAGGLFAAQPASAVPAAPWAHTLTQPNGQTFQSYYRGDEFFNWHVTADGRPIVQTANKTWVYAQAKAGGGLTATNLVVGQTATKDVIVPFMPPIPASAATSRASRDAKNAAYLAKRTGDTSTSGVSARAVPSSGKSNILVILVSFSDRAFAHTTDDFTKLLFGTTGKTMATYYTEISQGRFTVTSGPEGVVGVLKVSGTHDSYATNGDKLVTEAVKAADEAGVNFAPYDQDGDGAVDLTCVIHQGNGSETSGDNTDIHSYQGYLGTPYQTKDSGVKVDRYFLAPETVGGGLNTIGVFCHEYGHALGLPDLYDTDYTSSGIDFISLMASGNYGGNGGDTPVHMDAWCKLKLGWTNLKTITRTTLGNQIPAVEGGNVIYKIPISNTEYYLLENRQQKSFDASLPTTGLAIYHIDESIGTSNTKEWYLPHTRNGVSFPGLTRLSNYIVALEQADGQFDLESKLVDTGGPAKPPGQDGHLDAGDLYPGSTKHKEFVYKTEAQYTADPTLLPICIKYNGNRGADPSFGITNISDSADTMTADIKFTTDVTPTPVPTPPNNMFTKAQSLSSDGTKTSGSATGTTVGADKEDFEPDHAGDAGGASIWYSFSSPATGTLTIDTKGSGFDTTLAVYTGTKVNALTEVVSNNDAETGVTWSRVAFTAARNTTYYIAVDGYGGGMDAPTGAVKINWSETVVRPPNDMFNHAQTLDVMSTSVTGTNVNATHETGEPSPTDNAGAASVWYRWSCLQSGTATFSTQGSDFDTLLAAYTGSSVDALTKVAGNDDYVKGGGYSRITFAATAGTTYYIVVDGYLTTPLTYASGNIKLTSSVPIIYGISGTVITSTNGVASGIANIGVVATRTSDKAQFSAGTDKNGGYAILNLSPGTYTVAVSNPNVTAKYIGTVTMPVSVTTAATRRSGVNFQVQPIVRGKVYNAVALKTVSGVTIKAVKNGTSTVAAQTTTTTEGSYVLSLDPGTYTLSATSTDGSRFASIFTNPVTVAGTASASTTSYDFRAAGITGRVVTLQNAGVSGVTVNVYATADTTFKNPVASGVTDAQGFFSIEKIAAGTWNVAPLVSDRTVTPGSRTVTVSDKPVFAVFTLSVKQGSTTKDVSTPSPYGLSTVTADAQSGVIVLKFTGPLSAQDVQSLEHYAVTVNGVAVAVEAAELRQGTDVALLLPAGSVSAGSEISVLWSALHDVNGGVLSGKTTVVAK